MEINLPASQMPQTAAVLGFFGVSPSGPITLWGIIELSGGATWG